MFTVQSALCLCISTTLLIAYELCNSQLFAHFYTARDYLRRRCRWHSTIKCMLKCCFSCIRICKYTLPFAPFAFLLLYSPIRHAIAILSSNVIRRVVVERTHHTITAFFCSNSVFPYWMILRQRIAPLENICFFFSLSLSTPMERKLWNVFAFILRPHEYLAKDLSHNRLALSGNLFICISAENSMKALHIIYPRFLLFIGRYAIQADGKFTNKNE